MFFLAKADQTTLPSLDASTHAELALSATANGWIPRFPISAPGLGDHWGRLGYNDMPAGYFYVSGWVMRLFGASAWSAKLFPGLMSVLCAMLTYALGSLWGGPGLGLLGLLSGIILSLSREFFLDGLNAHLDTVMLAFILGSFLLWEKGRWIFSGVCAGLGLWFKSPVALLLFPSLAAAELLSSPRGGLSWGRWGLALGVALLTGSLIWVLTGALGGWELVRDYWLRQVLGTAIGGRGGALPYEAGAFFRILRTHYQPWTLPFLVGLVWVFRGSARWRERGALVPLSAAGVLITVISLMRFKYDHYFVPAYPFLALIAARPFAAWWAPWERVIRRGWSVAVFALGVFLVSTPVQTAPESYPGVRKFAAFIQSYGSCEDRILVIEGGKPYGTYADYQALLQFYTGRATLEASCEASAAQALQDARIAWVISSASQAQACLAAPEFGARFPVVFRYGNQILLTSRIPAGGVAVDLSPLARELQAPIDCRPTPLPRDRYHGPSN